ncbi:MAG: desulfoferrodoxin FeS4 iron-binding domain-containing protein [Candidatus Gastranaerophilales bacterium]|nr:desulfoferrodoxin FeS4 iron-binding domain-containing protein [Candidatus Gastranaerophilales bacterium]
MSKKFELYKCGICGKIAEIVIDGNGSLTCCNENMKLLETKSTDGTLEKHVPSIEHLGTSHVVKIGSIPHPMTDEHYIQFIEIISRDGRYLKRKYLNPDEEPEMVIKCLNEDDFSAREYCNIHGLYTEENNGK